MKKKPNHDYDKPLTQEIAEKVITMLKRQGIEDKEVVTIIIEQDRVVIPLYKRVEPIIIENQPD